MQCGSGAVRYGTVRCDVVWHGTARHSMVRCGTVRCGMFACDHARAQGCLPARRSLCGPLHGLRRAPQSQPWHLQRRRRCSPLDRLGGYGPERPPRTGRRRRGRRRRYRGSRARRDRSALRRLDGRLGGPRTGRLHQRRAPATRAAGASTCRQHPACGQGGRPPPPSPPCRQSQWHPALPSASHARLGPVSPAATLQLVSAPQTLARSSRAGRRPSPDLRRRRPRKRTNDNRNTQIIFD